MMQQHGFDKYDDFWKWSVTHKEEFWAETVQNLGIQFQEKYKSSLYHKISRIYPIDIMYIFIDNTFIITNYCSLTRSIDT